MATLSCSAVLAVGVGQAGAQGGTAKPPQNATAPFVEQTLVTPPFTVPPAQLHGFDSTGYLQAATVDTTMTDASGHACAHPGGTATINNTRITVPCNLTIQMPANTFTWSDFLAAGPDLSKAAPAFELRAVGNVVGTKRIAALMFLSQQSVNSGEGYIASIDYAAGSFTLDSGARVQLNDPKITTTSDPAAGTGRFSAGQSPDPRLSVDQANPTVKAATGYPMCIPRTDPAAGTDDPLCPQQNRPKAANCRNFSQAGVALPASGELAGPVDGQVYCSQYVMKDPAPNPPVGGVRTPTDPDSRQQVPFEVGDHVTYAGTLFTDATGPYVSAHTVGADIGVFTQPNSKPSYVAIETALIGSADPQATAVNGAGQETKDRLVLEVATTDVKSPVDGYLVDITSDPVNGALRNRWVTPYEMTGENQSGIPSGGITTQNTGPQPQRARLRATKAPTGLLSDPSRTIRVSNRATCTPTIASGQNQQDAVTASTATATPVDGCLKNLGTDPVTGKFVGVANGLQGGEYTAPMFDFIFPENVQPGTPIVPNDLWHLGFLRFGEGGNPDNGVTPVVGPLSPTPW